MDADYEAARAAELNKIAREWTKETLAKIKATGLRMNVRDSGRLLRLIKYRIKKRDGRPDILSLRMKRYGIFSITGTGKGVPASMAGSGRSKRQKKDFYNPTIEAMMPVLEQRLLDVEAEVTLRHYPLGNNNNNGIS